MKRISNIAVLLIFLLSVTGVSVSKHYSHGKLYSVAVFGEAQSCYHTGNNPGKNKSAHHCSKKDSQKCGCKTTHDLIKINQTFTPGRFKTLKVKSITLPATFCNTIGDKTCLASSTVSLSYIFYQPPPLCKNGFQSLLCSFLC